MSANFEAKKELVAKMTEQFRDANSIIFVDYKGITVAQDTILRKTLRENDVNYKVYKNRLMLRALNNLGIKVEPTLLEGATAVLFSKDEVAPAKLFKEAIDKYSKMSFKFGVLNNDVLSAGQVEDLAKIPSREILIAMLLGVLQGPASALARALKQIAEK